MIETPRVVAGSAGAREDCAFEDDDLRLVVIATATTAKAAVKAKIVRR
jgi:hypothetical protein